MTCGAAFSWKTALSWKACSAARASPAYKGGVLSPALERTTHCFYRWVARKMTEAAEANGAA